MLSVSFIKDFTLMNLDVIYILIALGVLLEGEIMVIISGVLVHLGSLNVLFTIFVIFIGCLLKSIIGYGIGLYIRKKHSNKNIICQAERRIRYFLPNFKKKPFASIFLSRFLILGIYWFTLIYAGFNKTKLKIFIKAEILSFFTWILVMMSLGYYFSYTALSISRDVRNFFILLLLFFVSFFILEKILFFTIGIFENKNKC